MQFQFYWKHKRSWEPPSLRKECNSSFELFDTILNWENFKGLTAINCYNHHPGYQHTILVFMDRLIMHEQEEYPQAIHADSSVLQDLEALEELVVQIWELVVSRQEEAIAAGGFKGQNT